MSQRAEQKLESKQRILREAAKLLRANGLSGTSVERAMRGAQLTVGAFYAHFKNKDELLSQAFAEAMNEMDAVLRDAAKGHTGRAALAAATSAYLSEEHMARVARGCPLPAVAGEATSSSGKQTHRMLAGAVATMRDRLVAVSSGKIDAGAALALCGLLVGGQILARATRGTEVSPKILSACRAAAQRLASGDDE